MFYNSPSVASFADNLLYASGTSTLNAEKDREASLQMSSATQSSFWGIPLAAAIDNVSPIAANKDYRGHYYDGVLITPENYLQLAQRRIAEMGIDPTSPEAANRQNAVYDAFRQMAGERPLNYVLDDAGAALPQDYTPPTFFENVERGLNVTLNDFRESGKIIESALDTASKKAGQTIENVAPLGGTVSIAVIGAALVGAFLLLK